jgi:hypothetical protein
VDTALLKAVVRAHRWRQMLESGKYASSAELAKAERVNASYVSRILRLTLIPPASLRRSSRDNNRARFSWTIYSSHYRQHGRNNIPAYSTRANG